jgi:8-oxo-dGTP pyrophosphatase MutT (NUDIX family)
MYTNIRCNKGCCNLKTSRYTSETEKNDRMKSNKAGGLLYDNLKESVLIIQSRGNLWGVPKGTLELDESIVDGTIREIYEETGLIIRDDQLDTYVTVDTNCTYFFIPFVECDVDIQSHIQDNDANSIGWIKLKCLKELIDENKIKLTKHTKIILKKFLLFD